MSDWIENKLAIIHTDISGEYPYHVWSLVLLKHINTNRVEAISSCALCGINHKMCKEDDKCFGWVMLNKQLEDK